jgi:hypothetical protein
VLTVACFLWKKSAQGFQLPSMRVTSYGPDWVIRLRNMVRRNYPHPHRFVCVTDDAAGLENVETIPLWDQCRNLGGCYNRLYIFSEDMREILGDRFIAIDLDCVITGDLTPVFHRTEPFVIARYNTMERDQRYNGSMILMDAGARAKVWNTFDPVESPRAIAANSRTVIGSDQAWIRLTLGRNEARFTEADGVYDYKHSKAMRNGLPDDARIVFFSGPRSPATEYACKAWIRQHWQ